MNPLLSVQGVTKRFGGLVAVADVAFDIALGELVGLIGPNGSGKTTLLNIMSGHLSADQGTIRLDGEPCTGMKPQRLARRGLMRMFQLTRIFPRMNVLDNLLVGGRALGLGADEARARANALLEELQIAHVRHLDAGQLSGGQMKLLEFGCCFMRTPRLALLDEPFAAIHPTMKEIMSRFIRTRHAAGQTFVLVSHDMPVIVELCPRSICMNAGRVLSDGATSQVLAAPAVIEAYLGGAAA
ncbi:MAG: branched-chain amino acid transport system ATP-binding protein [Methylobacteriaceae bacterium]|jgi:ABC-type branched-subunit amino acid transport system ATPase component|nr:branched-chain amino acid transport system ATP-binding protein [Methylobacteriaceae bacterium]